MKFTKCKNCGAELNKGSDENIKCSYCGTVYILDKPITQQSPQVEGLVDTKTDAEISSDTNQTEQDPSSKAVVFFMLMLFVFVIFVVIALVKNHALEQEIAAAGLDSLSVDTSAYSSEDSDVYGQPLPRIKKTNLDSALSIKGKVRSTKELTKIWITLKNNTKDLNNFDTYFEFEVFDKNGNKLETGDSNEREYYFSVSPGESTTEEWALKSRVPKAKKIKVKLQKVKVNDVIWDYR